MESPKIFWYKVKLAQTRLAVSLQKRELEGQPVYSQENILQNEENPEKIIDNNVLYIVSKRHNDRGTRAGFVVLTTVHLAGQRIQEDTHEIASAEQIELYQSGQAKIKTEIEQEGKNRAAKKFIEDYGAAKLLEKDGGPPIK